jgi:acyl-CoA synthetase (AMP-forming)/AMP-acid ligase II
VRRLRADQQDTEQKTGSAPAIDDLKGGRTKAKPAADLIAYCRPSLANYKIPRRVEFSETELPKGGSGKILKRVLRERFWVQQKRAV